MEWTYSSYIGVNVGISIVLVAIILIGVCGIFHGSKTGEEFITERVIGVNPPDVKDEPDNGEKEDAVKENIELETKLSRDGRKITSKKCIGVLFCILAIMTLSITAVLLFQGCFLASTRLLPDDKCPEYPMDCFVFNQTGHQPISDIASFRCAPSNKTQFPINIPDATAWCYGWIIRLQTTKNILDQLGVCTGLLGLFTTLLAIIVYLGRSIKTVVLCIAFIVCCIVAIILLVVFKWSLSPLTYAVLALGIALGLFGLLLYRVLPKPKDTKNLEQIVALNKSQTNAPSNTNISPSTSSPPVMTTTKIPRNYTKMLQRSSKVTPN